MTKDQYESMGDHERLIYDEMAAFAKRLSAQNEQITQLLQLILQEADK